jgi:hypothetical protein
MIFQEPMVYLFKTKDTIDDIGKQVVDSVYLEKGYFDHIQATKNYVNIYFTDSRFDNYIYTQTVVYKYSKKHNIVAIKNEEALKTLSMNILKSILSIYAVKDTDVYCELDNKSIENIVDLALEKTLKAHDESSFDFK